MTTEPLLSIIVTPTRDAVHIHADKAGLQRLRRALDGLIQNLERDDDANHAHLFSPEWGGWELSSTAPRAELADGGAHVKHVKVFAWPATSIASLELVHTGPDAG